MPKKKNINRMSVEKDFAKIFKHIKDQNFESKEELQEFVSNLSGQKIDDVIPDRESDLKDQSQDLVYHAYDLSFAKGKKLIEKALKLDPNNTDAYNYLAENERDVYKAIKLYKKAVKAGIESLGKNAFKENKGHFWGIFETRPFMRAKAGLSDCLIAMGEFDEAIDHYQEMLDLNPNDNQGIRYFLSTLFVLRNRINEYEQLLKQYPDERNAVWLFNYALYLFKKEGRTARTNKALIKAYEQNKHVVSYFLGLKKLPGKSPQYIGIGDENEAIACTNDTWFLWKETEGALDWLYEFNKKRLSMN